MNLALIGVLMLVASCTGAKCPPPEEPAEPCAEEAAAGAAAGTVTVGETCEKHGDCVQGAHCVVLKPASGSVTAADAVCACVSPDWVPRETGTSPLVQDCAPAPGPGEACVVSDSANSESACRLPLECETTDLCEKCPSGFTYNADTGCECTNPVHVADIFAATPACGAATAVVPGGTTTILYAQKDAVTSAADCEKHTDCPVAWSMCDLAATEKDCICMDGFVPNTGKDACLPAAPPSNSLVRDKDGEAIKCRKTSCPNSRGHNDTCASGWCAFSVPDPSTGVCVSPHGCPAGQPHSTARCLGDPLFSGGLQDESGTSLEVEPSTACPASHFCHTPAPGATPLCCPRPCPVTHNPFSMPSKVIAGRCVTVKAIGDTCAIDEECPGSDRVDASGTKRPASTCASNKCTCSKANGFKKLKGVCKKRCRSGEVRLGDRCLPVVRTVGEACQVSEQCKAVTGNVCRDSKCQCPCGQTAFDFRCITTPRCPAGGTDLTAKPLPFLLDFGEGPINCDPTLESNENCQLADEVSDPDDPNSYVCQKAESGPGGFCCPPAAGYCGVGGSNNRKAAGSACHLTTASGGSPKLCATAGEGCFDFRGEQARQPLFRERLESEGVCCAGNFPPVTVVTP